MSDQDALAAALAQALGPSNQQQPMLPTPPMGTQSSNYGPGAGYVPPEAIAAGAKPTIPQQDGNISTEKTINFQSKVDGQHYVIPTIINGTSYTPDAAVAAFYAGHVPPIAKFASQDEATNFAEQRSRQLDAAFGGGGVLRKGPSNPISGGLTSQYPGAAFGYPGKPSQ